jgi:ribosomal-protein-alanine N-acetyltransferase
MINRKIDVSHTVLETERLILRPFKEEDLEDFYHYASIEGVGECAGWEHHANKDVSRFILNMFVKEKKTFAIILKKTNQVIGSFGIEKSHFPRSFFPKETTREIGYVLAKEYWGQGLMSEATRRVIEYCFQDLKIDHLTVCHFIENDRSRRVIEKVGFQYAFTRQYKTQMGKVIESKAYILNNPHTK